MMRRARIARTAGIATGVATIAAAAAAARVMVTFRASEEERRRAMPGDTVVPEPMSVTTQAVTIDAPPDRVWPWLAQMGAGRGGWYSHDRIDNGGRPSATAIRAELQHVAPGDVFPAVPGATDAFIVAAVDPGRDLVLTVPAADGISGVSWEFFLVPLERARTRLLVRARVASRWREMAVGAPRAAGKRRIFIERVYGVLGRLPMPLMLLAGGFGHRVMQNEQLRGIKRRAEA
ncbi:MAG TPA: hypothetical protein VF041_17870 [Gemmatimonadaceae bacterium]